MDPLTAWANVATAALEFATEAIRAQTPEQKKVIIDWLIARQQFLDRLFKVDQLVAAK